MSVEKEAVPRALISRELLGAISIDTMASIAKDLLASDSARYHLLDGLTYVAPEVLRERLSWLVEESTGPMGTPKQVYFSPKAGVATVSVNTPKTLSDVAHMGDVEGEGGG